MAKKKPKEQSAPPQAQPIDYGMVMSQANKQAKTQYRDQLNAQIAAYPKLEGLQLGTISRLSGQLSGNNNAYTQRATNQLIAAEDQATQIGNIAADTERLSAQATQDLQGTDLERELQRQATSDLALGRSLNPEQARAATQQARAGMSARGLGTGTGALAAEVLNRDAYASAREAERRNFAGSTNQMLVGNRQNRLGLVGNILGQSANTRLNQANLRASLAGANISIDPYARVMNPALGLGGNTLGQSGSMIGNTYNQANLMSGNVASFNTNMLESRNNSYLNNKTALLGANIQAAAARDAATKSMIGSIAGSIV